MSSPSNPTGLVGWRLVARVDWIELEVTLPRPSQFRHVRRRTPEHWGAPYIEPLEPPESCRRFRLRVQDPSCPSALMADLQSLAGAPGAVIAEDDVIIVAVEVALDAYPPAGAGPDALADGALHLRRHHAHPPPGRAIVTSPGSFRAAAGRREVKQALAEGLTVNVGEPQAESRARYYVKRHDSVPGNPYYPLPPEQHRARMEVTLAGPACPIQTIDAWRSFKFQDLAAYFSQVLVLPGRSRLVQLLLDWSAMLGRPRSSTREWAHRRQGLASTARDQVLNERIRQALRGLTERTRTAEIRGGSAR